MNAPTNPLARMTGLAGAMRRTFGRWIASRSGNVGVLFALSAVPLIGITGLAIDYGYMLSVKARFDQAADAAAIAGSATAQTYLTSYTGSSNVTSAAQSAGQAQATAQFNANLGKVPAGTLTMTTPSVTVSGQTITTQVSYSFTMTPWLMNIFGTSQMTVSGASTSTVTMPTYVNVYVVIDNSESMGIGATPADQQIVYNNANNCAVACHFSGTEATVHNAGATLRIDVAKQAVIAGLQSIPSGGTYKVQIYKMSNALVSVFTLSNNIAAAITAVGTIDLASASSDGGSDSTYALTQLVNSLPTAGTGLTSATAQGIVMLITDAVQDSDMKVGSNGNFSDSNDPNFTKFSPCNQSSCWTDPDFNLTFESFDPAQCTPIKNKKYTMMTLDVKYLIPSVSLQGNSVPLQNAFSYIQNYLLNSIPGNMLSCATSSAYAFSANTPSEIASATTAMFNAIPLATQTRLSQ